MTKFILLLFLLMLHLPFFSVAQDQLALPQRLLSFLVKNKLFDKSQWQQAPMLSLHHWLREFDQAGLPEHRYLKMYPHCIQAAIIHQRSGEPECRLIEHIQTSVSDLPEFRAVIKTATFNRKPSVGISELPTPQKQFIYFAAQFILSSTFKCQSPTLYRFFNWYFDGFEGPSAKCTLPSQIFLTSIDSKGLSVEYETLDFSRLYQIHYLFASEGSASFSQFGHSMLRLVFCSPLRQRVGPDCLKDILYHRVASFRASVIEPNISVIDGLSGQYPSILFISPLLSIIKEYNGPDEFRNLISLPLNLDDHQTQAMLHTIIENHLGYRGSYYFFSNNCATETLRMLQQTLFTNPKLLATSIIRPDRLYRELLRLKMAHGYSLKQIKETPVYHMHLKQRSLLFLSEKPLLESQFQSLVAAKLIPPTWSLETYLESESSKREGIYNSLKFKELPPREQVRSLHRAISLEIAIEERLQLIVMKKLQQRLLSRPQNQVALEQEKKLRWALSSPQNFKQSNAEELRQIAESSAIILKEALKQEPMERQRKESRQFNQRLKQKLASQLNH